MLGTALIQLAKIPLKWRCGRLIYMYLLHKNQLCSCDITDVPVVKAAPIEFRVVDFSHKI